MDFIGNVNFQAQRDPIWSGGGYELDTCSVPYQGAITYRDAFVNGLSRFATLSGFSKVWLMRWPSDDEPHFPTVTLEYTGCKGGSVPPTKADDGQVVQTLTTTVTSTTYSSGEDIDIEMEIGYYAQQTRYSYYVLGTPPSSPVNNTARRVIDPASSIYYRRYRVVSVPTDSETTVGTIASVDTGTYTQLNNTLIPAHVVQEYMTDEIVPSALWHCLVSVNYQYNVL